MASPERLAAAEQAIRAAYERRRVLLALRGAWPVMLVVPLGLATRGASTKVLVVGALLALALVIVRFVGGAVARAAGPGVTAGLVPLVVPALVMERGHACAACGLGEAYWHCMLACAASGLGAGVLVGLWAAGRAAPRRTALVAAGLATLVGGLGCSLTGAAGLGGIALGALVGVPGALALGRAYRAATPRTSS